MTELDRMHARLDDARRFFRSERALVERRIAERERDAEIDALVLACTPWRLPPWGRL